MAVTPATPVLTRAHPFKAVVTRGIFSGGRVAQLHGQANAFAGHINFSHAHFNDVTGFDHLTCVSGELVAKLTHMNQTVLMHANINKCTKGRYVANGAFKLHAFTQVFDVFNTFIETRHFEVRARVAARFFKFKQNVFNRDHAKPVIGKQLRLERFKHVGAPHQLSHRLAGVQNNLLNHRVGFRVYTRHVQWIGAGVQPQKTSTLFKSFSPQAGNFE